MHPDSGGTGAEGALNENDEKKVHPVSGENFNLFAEGAESAENQRVCPITGATPNAGACSYHTRNESGLCGECPIGVADRFGGRTG